MSKRAGGRIRIAGFGSRIGIVGFGRLGQFLYEELSQHSDYEVVFVWNRSVEKLRGLVPESLILHELSECSSRSPDLIIEVAHPSITAQYGCNFLETSDYMIGSPTALSDDQVLESMMRASANFSHGLYVPAGALWGGHDIQKMADRGTLKGLKITMKKHPSAFKLVGYLAEKLKEVIDKPLVLYEGPVKDLCPLAPNNVNTMACAALAAHNLSFSGVVGCLVADPSLNSHVVEVMVTGPGDDGKNHFSVHTVRTNPSSTGVVTGKQTYSSFLSSVLGATGRGGGVHLC